MPDRAARIVAAKSPARVELEEGKTYVWCRCGRSKTQSFCDGSHKGTEITPLSFVAEMTGTKVLCRCKATANAPFCDGSHTRLGDLEVGDASPEPKSEVPTATPTPEEPTVARIHELARDGLSKLGHHGEMAAMGIPRKDLPHWANTQQFAGLPESWLRRCAVLGRAGKKTDMSSPFLWAISKRVSGNDISIFEMICRASLHRQVREKSNGHLRRKLLEQAHGAGDMAVPKM